MDRLACAPVEYIYWETLAKTFIIPVRQNQFIHENVFNKAPVRRVAIAMNTNSAFTSFFFPKTNSGVNNLIPDKLEYSGGGQPILQELYFADSLGYKG